MARKRKLDPKAAALVETRTLNPRPEAVRDDQICRFSPRMASPAATDLGI